VLTILLQLLQTAVLMNVWTCVCAAGAARHKQYSSRSYSSHGYILPHCHLLWRGLVLVSDFAVYDLFSSVSTAAVSVSFCSLLSKCTKARNLCALTRVSFLLCCSVHCNTIRLPDVHVNKYLFELYWVSKSTHQMHNWSIFAIFLSFQICRTALASS